MFTNQRIYNVVDMSNIGGWSRKLPTDEFRKLGQKLTFIINCLTPEIRGRMRFLKHSNIDNFELISDNKCRSPFPGQTLTNITNIRVTVSGDDVTIINGSDTVKYHIDDYGIL